MQVRVPIYERRSGGIMEWHTVGLGRHDLWRYGRSPVKLQQQITDALKKILAALEPAHLGRFQLAGGVELRRLPLQLSFRGVRGRSRISGRFPLILEPRWFNRIDRVCLAYHPERPQDWFAVRDDQPLADQATRYFQHAWAEVDEAELLALRTDGGDRLRLIAFEAATRSVLDLLPQRETAGAERGMPGGERGRGGALSVLPKIGINDTLRAMEGALPGGMPRPPYRSRLSRLLGRGGGVVLVGPPGAGKRTLLDHWVGDQLEQEGYPIHRNMDRVRHVWRISAKRIIAGMSFLGDWEQRCVELLAEVAGQPPLRRSITLRVEDLHTFGAVGRSRQSDRCLATFFTEPLRRGAVRLVGCCTESQLAQLEEDAPAFAALLERLVVHPASEQETLEMMVHEVRQLEARYPVAFEPGAYRAVLETGGSIAPGAAWPGKALDCLRALARGASGGPARRAVSAPEVIALVAQRTGLPEALLRSDARLLPETVEAKLRARVMGQPAAVAAATDLVLRIRGGLTDPGRPYGVYLFTGPTGTGKTELARSIAATLYSDARRLVRLDMSELSGPDAPSRLIGRPGGAEGLLTRPVGAQPFCVVLLDEIEKAHPAVLNLMLQLFDEGRLTDARGQRIDFTRTVVVMTSNLGTRARAPVGFGGSAAAELADIAKAVRGFFPPELFNRIDRVVPFSHLDRATSRHIARKALGRLLARRGLVERNIFVEATEAVVEQIVEEAFDPRDGARPLKRYLEDVIGARLAQAITSRGPAALQRFHLYVTAPPSAGVALHVETMSEAPPIDAEWALEPLLDQPVLALQAALGPAIEWLEALRQGDRLEAISRQIEFHLEQHNLGRRAHAEPLVNLDGLRAEVVAFGERLRALAAAPDDEAQGALLEVDRYSHDTHPSGQRVRIFDPRWMEAVAPRPAKDELLEAISRICFLRRGLDGDLDQVGRPDRHAAVVEVLRLGSTAGSASAGREGLLQQLVMGYLEGPVELQGWAAQVGEAPHHGPQIVVGGARALDRALAAMDAGACRIVLELVGLLAFDWLEGETGCHTWHSLAGGTEVVRVQVRPGAPGIDPGAELAAAIEARRAFESALEAGGPVRPPNPDGLLPAVRHIRFDRPRPGETAVAEVEDYRLGWSGARRVAHLSELLRVVWALGASRIDRDPAP